ncbi:hypothetical protein SCALM49S_08404 [Streptomyces californicus]
MITGRDPHDVGGRDLLGDLVKHVCPAGPDAGSPAPGCTGKGDFHGATNTDGQALSVLALLRGAVEPPAADRDPPGPTGVPQRVGGRTFIRPGENCTGDPMSTALVAPVLKAVGGHDAAVTKARTYLRKARSEAGAFLAYEGAPAASVAATAYAAQALRALGETKAADAAVASLSREQLDGGGFGYNAGDTEDQRCTRRSPPCSREQGVDLVSLVARPRARPPADHSRSRRPAQAAPRPTPRPPGAGPDLKKGVAFLTRPSNLLQGRYYDDGTRKDGGVRHDDRRGVRPGGDRTRRQRAAHDRGLPRGRRQGRHGPDGARTGPASGRSTPRAAGSARRPCSPRPSSATRATSAAVI